MAAAVPLAPPAELLHRAPLSLGRAFTDLWRHRVAIWGLTSRSVRVRYTQSVLGIAWALVVPLSLTIVFTVFTQRASGDQAPGVPYVLWAYVGILPWTFSAHAITSGGQSFLVNAPIVKKVGAPRTVFPVSSMLVAAFDAAAASVALVGLFAVTTTVPPITAVLVVPLIALQLVFTLALVVSIACVAAYSRDIGHGLPVAVQAALFATPVLYTIELDGWQRWLYAILNPLATVIDGYRAVLVAGHAPAWDLVIMSTVAALVALVLAMLLFRLLDPGIPDVL